MTAEELFRILEHAVRDGHGEAPVYFDTEGRTFGYHMAKIGRAYLQDIAGDGSEFWITLHEVRKK